MRRKLEDKELEGRCSPRERIEGGSGSKRTLIKGSNLCSEKSSSSLIHSRERKLERES